MEFDLRKAINAISDVVQNRPAPIREFDQIYMKVADMVIQAEYVARVFNNKNVVFVGDGDGIALSTAHLKAQNVINYGPNSIAVLDFDERIVNSVRRFGEKLHPKIEVSAYLYNVAEALSAEHSRGRKADEYLIGQVDKGCFLYKPPELSIEENEQVIKHIELVARVKKPYAVFLRN
jgi:predicted methyltransferase